MSAIRLAWLDSRAVEQLCAVDELEWMFGFDDGDECCYYDDQWNGSYDHGVWIAGCCCECQQWGCEYGGG